MKILFLLVVWGGIALHAYKKRSNDHWSNHYLSSLEAQPSILNSQTLGSFSYGDKPPFYKRCKVPGDYENPFKLLIKTNNFHITNTIKNVTETNLKGKVISRLNDAMNLGGVGFTVEVLEDSFLRGSKVDAECIPVNEFTVQILINPDLSWSSHEFIASTIIHEYIHATWLLYEMYYRFHNSTYGNPILDQIEQKKLLGMNLNSAHHMLMMDIYYEELENELEEVFPQIRERDKKALTKNGIIRLTTLETNIVMEHRNGYRGLDAGRPTR